MKKLLAPVAAFLFAVAICGLLVGAFQAGTAQADGSAEILLDAGVPLDAGPYRTPGEVDAGVGSATTPADALRDPLEDPAGAISDFAAAKRTGWVVLVFAVLTVLCRLLGKLGRRKDMPKLAWLGKGKVAVGIGLGGALGAAGYNALMDGGSYYAMIAALLLGGATWWDAQSKDPS